MKPNILIVCAISLIFTPLLRAQEAAPLAIDDLQIKTSFEKQLGDLKSDGQAPEPSSLKEQLKERAHHAIDLPPANAIKPVRGTASIYENRRASVLCFGNIFKCDHCNKWHGNIAGGFVITADGIAVTNYHVMDAAKAGAFGAMTIDGKMHLVEKVLAASKRDDLAIVKLAGDGFTPAPLAQDTPVGAKVIAISHPEGRFYSASEGIISRYYRLRARGGEGPERLAITADFAKGSSGSPVFSARGEVIGVVASTNSIYYDRDGDGDETNLQMVIKSCIPSGAIFRLLSKTDEKASDTTDAAENDAIETKNAESAS